MKSSISEEIINLYRKYGASDYIGEAISQLEHASQSAQLAQNEGYAPEIILAAFLHDIGHICMQDPDLASMKGFGVRQHEKLGADFLRQRGLPEKIARLVENHVQAKRYLTFKFPDYYEKLSPASKQTLEYQGGKMSEEEASKFEQDDLHELSLKMRTWDEQAKETNIPLIGLDYIATLIDEAMNVQKP
jgi:2-amino-1-hydroxyethylphosphonate dioxygenase (glycine-forming)